MSVQKWANEQVASLSRAEFGETYDQWFRDEISLQDLFDYTLSKERKRALSRAMEARNERGD